MRELPAGTVTFFFSDIEASTRLAASLGDRFADVLAAHRALVRAAFAEHGGIEISTEGDSFFAVFSSAPAAVLAAAAVQQALAAHPWPADGEVRVRIGLHTGQAVRIGHDYVGIDVNRAARIAAAGHGGQVLVSATARAAALQAAGGSADRLPDGLVLDDLGRHRLKDVGPERLWQLAGAGLPSGFGPLRSLEAHPSNLPLELSPLVDREDERTALVALVRATPLVTVTGPGGIGKSRLALRAARDLLESFPDGVFHLDLASVDRSDAVVAGIAEQLGVRPPPDGPLLPALLDHMRDRELLVVLETADRVADLAGFLGVVAGNCPRTRVLVTSRSPLHASAEREIPLRPLAADAAVALFIARARAVRPDFAPAGPEAAAVAEICARLDGLPLAIELAAARVRLLGVQTLLERLANRLPLLGGGARDAPDRQRTLRDTIAWSHELLGPDEQALLGRLATFVGPFDLVAAEAVAPRSAGSPAGGPADALELLGQLVDRSLVATAERGEGDARAAASDGRFRLLQTIREFALERLAATGDHDAARDAHGRYWLDFARANLVALDGPDDLAALAAAKRAQDDLRSALGWLLDGGAASPEPTPGPTLAPAHGPTLGPMPAPSREPHHGADSAAADARRAVALDLAGTLGRSWWLHGHVREGVEWLERALAAAPDAPPAVRSRALFWSGVLHDDQRDAPRAAERLEACLALQRSIGDERAVARTLNSLGVVARSLGDLERAEALLTESLERKRALGDEQGAASTLSNLGLVAHDRGRLDDAIDLLRQALRRDEASGARGGAATSLVNLGGVLIDTGRIGEGLTALRSAMPVVAELADPELVAELLEHLGQAALADGGATGAAAATRLLLTAQVLRDREGLRLRDVERAGLDKTLLAATARLDVAAVEQAAAEARAMDLDAALALAAATLAGGATAEAAGGATA
jgi:predicted ATPase/class 3 adenylate cyclase